MVQNRWDARRWSIRIPRADCFECFAPAGGLFTLHAAPAFAWFRVTDGPFRGAFIVQSGGGLEVVSRDQVCGVAGTIPAVEAECGRN